LAPSRKQQLNKSLSKVLVALIVIVSIASVLIGLLSTNGVASTGRILINEVMAGNKSAVVDDMGKYSDWIELYNPGNEPVSIEGWGLSDSKSVPVKWAFPNVTMAPGSYLLVFMSKEDHRDPQKPLHANFGLSSKGESVVLTDNLGTVVDIVSFSTMGSDVSLGRNPGDISQWIGFEAVTPGYANTPEGHTAYLNSLKAASSDIRITEVMSSNATTLLDDYGLPSDWVEIYNAGKATVNLQGYGLSDKANKLMKWTFPDVSLESGKYLFIFCSSKNQAANSTSKALHTNFSISSYKETIVLSSNRGQVLDTVAVPQMEADSAYALDLGSGAWRTTVKPTPGYPNTDEGYRQFNDSRAVKTGLMISEAMTYNSKYAPVGTTYHDWIEIYNGTGAAVNLRNYGLTDDTSKPLKWKFPDVSIAAGGYLVVYCSGLNQKGTTLHTNFRLSAAGETVGLFDPSEKVVDAMGIGEVPSNMSFGRVSGKKGFFYFQTPSPLAANSGGAHGFAEKPVIALSGGNYRGAQQVTISTGEAGALIRYTTDGSIPGDSSPQYMGTLSITKTTALRARAFKSDLLGSSVATASYFIDVPHNLPIVSLVTDPDNLFSNSYGIYVLGAGVNDAKAMYPGANFWKDWERDVHFEYIQEDGKLGVALDGGIKIFGAYSRIKDQKGLSIFARSRYGTDSIAYPFFTTRPSTEYKSIVLRAGAQDSTQSKIRDIVITDLVRAYSTMEVSAYRQCVVYINGQYWGYYNIREKINKYMIAQHNNLKDPESIDLIVGNSRALVGDNEDYKAMINYITANDITRPEVYDRVCQWMDVENYMDWIICEAWTNNADLGNIKFWRERSGQGKWRWIFYDFCWGMYNPEMDGIARMINPGGMGAGHAVSTVLIRSLLKNNTFRQQFLARCNLHFNTTFAPDRVLAKINECVAAMEDEIGRDRARWNSGTAESWRKVQIAKMESFAKVRSGYMIYFVRKNMNLTEAETVAIFGSAGVVPPVTN
jgi:hypothetical protein